MKFDTMNLDEKKQVAELYYTYQKRKIVYIVNTGYRESSWGIDIEDSIEKEYSKEINGCNMNIVVYKVENSNQSRCVSKFKYEGVEYFMMGLMEEGDFEKILKNLVFPK